MATQAGARETAARPLLGFLAASRPERPDRASALATGASIGAHALLLTLAAWASTTADPSAQMQPQLAHEYAVDLLPPAVLDRAVAEPGARTVTVHPSAEAKHARARLAHAADRTAHRSPGSELVAARRALQELTPPDVPLDVIPPPTPATFASLDLSEYGGIGGDSTYSAAAIVADHHDKSVDELASAAPQFTPYTAPPELSNPDQVRRQLSREYPMFLQDNGIGGRVILWFLVDETGRVRKWLLKQSSGHKALDQAALKVAALMRFRPAMNYDRRVSVWVVLPVTFQVVDAS